MRLNTESPSCHSVLFFLYFLIVELCFNKNVQEECMEVWKYGSMEVWKHGSMEESKMVAEKGRCGFGMLDYELSTQHGTAAP